MPGDRELARQREERRDAQDGGGVAHAEAQPPEGALHPEHGEEPDHERLGALDPEEETQQERRRQNGSAPAETVNPAAVPGIPER